MKYVLIGLILSGCGVSSIKTYPIQLGSIIMTEAECNAVTGAVFKPLRNVACGLNGSYCYWKALDNGATTTYDSGYPSVVINRVSVDSYCVEHSD